MSSCNKGLVDRGPRFIFSGWAYPQDFEHDFKSLRIRCFYEDKKYKGAKSIKYSILQHPIFEILYPSLERVFSGLQRDNPRCEPASHKHGEGAVYIRAGCT